MVIVRLIMLSSVATIKLFGGANSFKGVVDSFEDEAACPLDMEAKVEVVIDWTSDIKSLWRIEDGFVTRRSILLTIQKMENK
jgi:hypothetical protein